MNTPGGAFLFPKCGHDSVSLRVDPHSVIVNQHDNAVQSFLSFLVEKADVLCRPVERRFQQSGCAFHVAVFLDVADDLFDESDLRRVQRFVVDEF